MVYLICLWIKKRLLNSNLENALNVEEMFWQEKSKVQWHCEGDRNTSYFHRVAKIRNVSSHISTMKSGDITLDDPELISAHVVNHFTNIFTNSSNVSENGLIEEVVPNLITDRVNNMLTMLPTHDEISKVVFALNKNSAPGPDGFGAIFFQTYWEIIKHDVFKAVMQFFYLWLVIAQL
jgi:hypothetical protein